MFDHGCGDRGNSNNLNYAQGLETLEALRITLEDGEIVTEPREDLYGTRFFSNPNAGGTRPTTFDRDGGIVCQEQ